MAEKKKNKSSKKKTSKKRALKRKTKKRRVRKKVSDAVLYRTKVRVIGIGGGGGTIVSEIAPRIKRASFVAANTDTRALKQTGKRIKKFHFGQELTCGLGTGMNVELGEMAAQQEKDKIKSLFEGQDLCIIIASLGGGTGSGAAPAFAKISKRMNCLTFGIFTLPFRFEGEKKTEIAKDALKKIKPHLNAFSIIPNERIFRIIDKNTPLKEALSAINKQLVENLEGLIEMIYLPGLINIDFADLCAVLKGRGKLSYLNTIEIEKNRGEESLKKLISSSLYPYTIKGARGILYNIVGGKDIELTEVSRISSIISDIVNKRAKIIFGISQKRKLGDKINITLLATGCFIKELLKNKEIVLKPKKKKYRKKKPKGALGDKKTEEDKKKKEEEARPVKSSEAGAGQFNRVHPVKSRRAGISPPASPQRRRGEKAKLFNRVKKEKPEKEVLLEKPEEGKTKEKKVSLKPKKKPAKKKSLKSFKKRASKKRTLKKVRRNALEVKKKAEQEEKEILEREEIWEKPAILRRKEY